MWIFGKHRHINPDTLSEYLDGRLSLRDKARVDRAIAACARCQGATMQSNPLVKRNTKYSYLRYAWRLTLRLSTLHEYSD